MDKYAKVRDPITLRIPQILGGITGFTSPELVCGLVDKNSFALIKSTFPIRTVEVRFFGYLYQCEKHIQDYPDTVLITNLLEKILR